MSAKRDRAPLCRCGYDLTGLAIGSACPECDADIVGSLRRSAQPEAPPKSDERPLPLCRQCGYNLTGRLVDERCPECGRWVWSAGTLAVYSMPAILSGVLGLCAVLLFWTGPLAMLLGVISVVLARRAWVGVQRGRFPPSALALSGIGQVLALIGFLGGACMVAIVFR